MTQGKSLFVYTTALDDVLLQVVGPFIEAHAASLDRTWWERHYAGGPHLRVFLRGGAGVDRLAGDLHRRLNAWLLAHPAAPLPTYIENRAAQLLRAEGCDVAREDLSYRNNVVIERPYAETAKVPASPGAKRLIENFRRARGFLALDILRTPEARDVIAFKLYLVLALFVGRGRYVPGSVSLKSHWEHFAATVRSEAVTNRIRASYEQNRGGLLAIATELEDAWKADRLAGTPLLGHWLRLLRQSYEEITTLLSSGEALTEYPVNREEARLLRSQMMRNVRRSNAFVEGLWEDERFTAGVHREITFQRPRALVNLLYDVVAALGLSPLDRIAICHHAFRTVEEHSNCNLDDVMRRNVAIILERCARNHGCGPLGAAERSLAPDS